MNAIVKDDVCIGCGMCADIEPAVFRMNEDGLAEAYAAGTDKTSDKIGQAIEACPVDAIEEA
ncbi:MAG: ferredoxin [Velocimicrobium sp.]